MLQACITCRQNARCCTAVSRCSIYRSTQWRRRASDRCRRCTKRVYSCKPHNIRQACKPHSIRQACKPHTRLACRPRIRRACKLTRRACRLRIRRACRPRIRRVCRPHIRPACRCIKTVCSCQRGRCARTTRATRRPPRTARPERRAPRPSAARLLAPQHPHAVERPFPAAGIRTYLSI